MSRIPRHPLWATFRLRVLRALGLICAVSFLSSVVAVSPAAAMGAPIHTTDWVNIRPGPSVSSGNPLGVIPPGTSPDFNCWMQGQNINGVDVWFSVNYGGHTGYYASYYDDSSYSTDLQITPKYGIPHCGSGATGGSGSSGATPAENAAISWSQPYANAHDTSYNGLCLMFVFRAWAAAGVNLRQWVSVPIGSNTYPQDIWGHFTHGSTGGGQPPAGALVFFESRTGNRAYSHVALSLGGGNLVSTADSIANYTHYETVAQHNYAIYLGWWLPDR
jgi:hypothetical protein